MRTFGGRFGRALGKGKVLVRRWTPTVCNEAMGECDKVEYQEGLNRQSFSQGIM